MEVKVTILSLGSGAKQVDSKAVKSREDLRRSSDIRRWESAVWASNDMVGYLMDHFETSRCCICQATLGN